MSDNKGTTVETVNKSIEEKASYGIKAKSKEVWIRHKPNTMGVPFQNVDSATLNKIGSSFSKDSQDVLRGLTFEEECKLLPSLIGTQPTSERWDKDSREYWANISKTIPPSEKDGSGGLKLEIGRIYSSQEDEDYDSKINDESKKRGKLISPADYILWRYCLVYNRVANNIEDIHKSPKIDFYLYSKEEEVKAKKSIFKIQQTAYQLLYSKLADRQWVDWVLRLFVASDKESKVFIKDLDKLSDDEKDVLLKEKYVDKFPERFISIGNDKSLEIKAFIELCVIKNTLSRIPNTDTIQMGDTVIGHTVSEAVGFLTNPKNAKTLDILKAQANVMP